MRHLPSGVALGVESNPAYHLIKEKTMKQINMTCLVDLPDNLFEEADMTLKVRPAWEAFLSSLRGTGVEYSVKLDIVTLDSPRKRSGKIAPTPRVTLPVADATEEAP